MNIYYKEYFMQGNSSNQYGGYTKLEDMPNHMLFMIILGKLKNMVARTKDKEAQEQIIAQQQQQPSAPVSVASVSSSSTTSAPAPAPGLTQAPAQPSSTSLAPTPVASVHTPAPAQPLATQEKPAPRLTSAPAPVKPTASAQLRQGEEKKSASESSQIPNTQKHKTTCENMSHVQQLKTKEDDPGRLKSLIECTINMINDQHEKSKHDPVNNDYEDLYDCMKSHRKELGESDDYGALLPDVIEVLEMLIKNPRIPNS